MSGDGYSKQFDEIASDFPNNTKCIDDTLLWADSLEESFYRTCEWLHLCGRNSITLNPENSYLHKTLWNLLALKSPLMTSGPANDSLKLSWTSPFPATSLIYGLGLVNQVAYTFSITEKMLPFRDLLKSHTPF